MLNEMIGVYYLTCPVCGRYHRTPGPIEYWWCPCCGSNLQSQINELKKRVTDLETYLKEEAKEEIQD